MYKISNKEIFAASAAFLVVSTVAVSVVSKLNKLKKQAEKESFERDCMYMAYMDDEVGRKEFNGKKINGDIIKFPPKKESLYYRYQLFKELYGKYSPEDREKELRKLEQRYYKYKVTKK